MLRGIEDGGREFIGRDAIMHEIEFGTTRWTTVGVALDVDSYERLYADLGLIPPKEGVLIRKSLSLYSCDLDVDSGGTYVGYVTSLSWSPMLKRHVALAKVPLAMAPPGTEVFVELTVTHRPRCVAGHVVPIPFFDPARKTAATGRGSV
jgi:aminomethyltransferase